MYEIHFYKDRNGKEPVKEYIAELASRKDKNSRIKLNKIMDYVKTLSEYGTQAGEPYIKHLRGIYGNCGHYGIESYLPHGMATGLSCYILL